jgi:large subunit ribosomal protein L24e
MVIKTNICAFSDSKIYPGHGLRYCEVNGRSHMFLNKKVHRFFKAGRKPLKFRWTIKWRVAHKKGKTEESKRKVVKERKVKEIKAVVGRTVEEMKKLKESLEERQLDAQRYKYAQEIKEKKKKYLEKVRKNKPTVTQDNKTQQKVAKNVAKGQTKKR